ncbi:MAG: ribosome-associated ATPase/putative transporter RbbA [Isosphaeraceae bacterium]
MSTTLTTVEPVAAVRGVSHAYGATRALDNLDLDIPPGRMVALIGPDGVGKSTLMGLIAGSKKLQAGTVRVLGGEMGDLAHREAVCPRIAYMPQGLGKNLYFELSVFENIDFFARLFGVPDAERGPRIQALLEATGLGPFPDRPAGKLSGGMKQKVGLCGALIHDPDLLILDEPTTGVDPLSRQQFWALIDDIRRDRPGMSVLVSTAYMEEAQRFDWTIAMDAGRVIARGTPDDLMRQAGATTLEDAFVSLLPGAPQGGRTPLVVPPREDRGGPPAIEADGLTKRFGNFTAVDRVSFTIPRGEIFGFLGSNGCGKSTTMKMLVGLLPATEGTATLFGKPIDANDLETRKHVGYMSQAFSLYGELTCRQNLELHARIFDLPPSKARDRINELVDRFGLRAHLDADAESLPLGLKQRLSLAVAVLHGPEILLLDEPTSGVDPVARDEFWELLIDLSRAQGVTIFVSTHFMNEALRCDRISLMHAGKVLACDAPKALIEAQGAADLDTAFIAYMAGAEADRPGANKGAPEAKAAAVVAAGPATSHATKSGFSPGRMLAYARREAQEIQRDPVRLIFAFLGSALMMLAFGYGITTDVENIRFASYDVDQTPESRAYLAAFEGSRYFVRHHPAHSIDELEERLKSHEIEVALEISANFGRNLREGNPGEVTAWVDGAPTNRGENLAQYVQGVHMGFLRDQSRLLPESLAMPVQLSIQSRFAYNPAFESVYAIVPSIPAILLVLIPAILMAVSIVREKELGSIVNFYVTPTTRVEFLTGKQLPYIAIGMVNYAILLAMTVGVFGVPLKGSGLMLTLCTLLYVVATTGVGMLISTFTGSQVAAVFVTTILTLVPTTQFSGLLQPVSTLDGGARAFGTIWPTTYYMHASVGAFTKGLTARELLRDALALAAFIPILVGLSVLGLPRQET